MAARKARKPVPLSTEHIGNFIAESATTIFELEHQISTIARIGHLCVQTLQAGRKLLSPIASELLPRRQVTTVDSNCREQ